MSYSFSSYPNALSSSSHSDDFLCPDWELDIARQTTLFNVHEITNLSALIPKSPIAEMSFPVLTALDNTSRIFYVFGMPDQGAAHIWVAQLDANVSKADVAPVVVWTFSDPSMTLVRVHVGAKGVVYGVFQTGEVVIVDTTKGQVRHPRIHESGRGSMEIVLISRQPHIFRLSVCFPNLPYFGGNPADFMLFSPVDTHLLPCL